MSVIFNPKIDKVNSVVNQESVSLPEKIPNPTGQIEASPG